MNENLIKCYHCQAEKLPQSIFYYYAKKNNEKRPICSDCKVGGSHWGN